MNPRGSVPVPDLSGRVALVTGGTSGIGEAVARRFADAGATVIIVGRDPARAATAFARLRSGGHPERFDLVIADLAESAGIRSVALHVTSTYPSLDILVNNAGMFYTRRRETREGVERTWALNVLAPFRLTEALRVPLAAADRARVVNVASEAHRGRSLDLSDLEARRHYRGFGTYGRSKVALILLTQEFARRWGDTPVTFFSVHPGFVRTRFGLNNPGPVAWLIRLLGFFFAIRPERGSETPVLAATSPSLVGWNGSYLSRGRLTESSSASRDPDTAARVWTALEATEARIRSAKGA